MSGDMAGLMDRYPPAESVIKHNQHVAACRYVVRYCLRSYGLVDLDDWVLLPPAAREDVKTLIADLLKELGLWGTSGTGSIVAPTTTPMPIRRRRRW